jgi:hypothetical protein
VFPDPPAKYARDFQQAFQRWSTLGRKPARLELLDTLVRFELTSEQVRRICDPEERAKSGIQALASKYPDLLKAA